MGPETNWGWNANTKQRGKIQGRPYMDGPWNQFKVLDYWKIKRWKNEWDWNFTCFFLTFRGGPIWTGSNGLIWEQGKIIKNVIQRWRFSKKGRNQGRPYMDRPWNLKGVNDEPKLKVWGWQRKNQWHKVGERKNWRPQATLPQTDLTSSLTTHVCEVQVLKFWAETTWAKGATGTCCTYKFV